MGNQNANTKARWETSYMNNRTFLHYYNRLTELAISMFEWKGFPPSVDTRFLELILYSDGMAIFFKDEVLGCLTLQAMVGGNLDVYRVPKKRRAYATNGYNLERDEKNSVIIYNNYIRTNTMIDMEMYAKRLYDVQRTMDVNINAQKTPVMIQCTEEQRLTMVNLLKKYEGNEPFIFSSKNVDLRDITVLQTGAPFVAPQLMELKFQIWNEALTQLGIANNNIQKKERLLTDEVSRNMGSTVASKYTRLNARQEAAKKISEMFDLDITVDYREDIEVLDDGNMKTVSNESDGDKNE